MTCQICGTHGRVTSHQNVQNWYINGGAEAARYIGGGSDAYTAARTARAYCVTYWGAVGPCNMCIPEPVRQPSPIRARTPSPPRPPPLPKPRASDVRDTTRRLSEQSREQREQAPSNESLAAKLKRTMKLSDGAAGGTSGKLKSVFDAGRQAMRDQVEARTRTAQEFAQAGRRMADNVADAVHSVRTDAEDVSFAFQQEFRIRSMCREQTYEAGARCAADIANSFTNASLDDGIDAVAQAAAALSTGSVKNFMKASGIMGAASILKRPDCREFIRGSVSNQCVEDILPNGYVNVSTRLPRRRPEGN